MSSYAEIQKTLQNLHDKKVINLDSSVGTVLAAGNLPVSQAEKAGWYAIGGDHYVIVCGLQGQLGQAVNPGQ